ncbi:hypothetical protein WMY93_007710 [Mugilogobius chulae]|uniref:Uncharacterized protein n=1 Tax=Mugilogobius chulae TaxID=88201 RepID=A0AAW0PPG6_9GOBI
MSQPSKRQKVALNGSPGPICQRPRSSQGPTLLEVKNKKALERRDSTLREEKEEGSVVNNLSLLSLTQLTPSRNNAAHRLNILTTHLLLPSGIRRLEHGNQSAVNQSSQLGLSPFTSDTSPVEGEGTLYVQINTESECGSSISVEEEEEEEAVKSALSSVSLRTEEVLFVSSSSLRS